MQKTTVFYWIFTGLLAALMGFSSIPNILSVPDAIVMFEHLGYPAYLLPFLGIAKLLGVIAILVPGFPRLKEWAYAGLCFDLAGAMYSIIRVGDPVSGWLIFIPSFGVLAASYMLLHKKRSVRSMSKSSAPAELV